MHWILWHSIALDATKLGYTCTPCSFRRGNVSHGFPSHWIPWLHCTGYHKVGYACTPCNFRPAAKLGYHKVGIRLHHGIPLHWVPQSWIPQSRPCTPCSSAVVLSTRAFRCTGNHRVGIRLYSMQFPPWQCQPWHLVALDIIELGHACDLVASAVAATMAFRCTGHRTTGIRLYSMQLPPWQCQPWHFVALDNTDLGYVCNSVASAVALAAMAFRRTGYHGISLHWRPRSLQLPPWQCQARRCRTGYGVRSCLT